MKTYSCEKEICELYFLCVVTILPADLEVFPICWSCPPRKMIRDMGVSNRRSLGFVQIWQERGEEGKGRANSKAGQGRICRRRTIGQNQFPQSATRALSQNISICLFPLSSWHQQGSYHETAKPKLYFVGYNNVSTVNNRIIVTADNSNKHLNGRSWRQKTTFTW